MEFVMPVERTVPTDKGHTIYFKANVPTHVPKECWPAVQAAGAVPTDQKAVAAEQDKKPKDAAPDDPAERKKQVFAAFEIMVASNKREDFTGSGSPQVKAIEKLTGFEVDGKERDTLWTEFQQAGLAQ